VWGNFGDPYRQMMNAGDDWVYLVLDRCLGAKYGYFSLRAVDPDDFDIQSTRFSSIGYSAGEQRIDPACSLQIGQNSHWGVWLHDCALMPGDSGGPILKQGTLAAVAIGASFFGGPGCPKVPRPARDLPSWANDNCANAAVPLTPALIDHIEAAQTAVAVQRLLGNLGYDSGQLGAIDEPPASEAIRRVERDMGWPVTGVPTEFLRKILMLRSPIS
jgi:hypothetical protein